MNGEAKLVLDQAALNDLFTSPSAEVGVEITRRTIKVNRRAKELCPVDTGRLRSSITYAVGVDAEGLFGQVGTDVEYAAPVEFNTKAFLRPALDAAKGTDR